MRSFRKHLDKKAYKQVDEAEASSSLQTLTIIILTHQRHHYLKRCLDFYSKWRTQIIVLDSSEERYPSTLPHQVKYLHRPEATRACRLNEALQIVQTRLTLLAADDDFISPIGVNAAHDWLEKHDECSCVQGWHGGFSSLGSGIGEWRALHKFARDYSVNDKTPEARIIAQSGLYMNCIYALHRTEALRLYYCDICPKLGLEIVETRPDLLELGQAITSVTLGSHVVLPVFWIAREMMSDSDGELCKAQSLDSDLILDLFFERLASALTNLIGANLTTDVFQRANQAYRNFHHQWHQLKIPHSAPINEILCCAKDRAVAARIVNTIARHPFAH